ncbi:hypothetical protein GIB67_027332 [Kingdonia uniflora]|uniref:Uncharacterized protein n=1 Tax=Kingdonia uniflora TaxID=39325 RepID=A0A7J7MEY2_9MAGN|nr:hypothetical protein GIB67_027332 [Kingdonia uniflora]
MTEGMRKLTLNMTLDLQAQNLHNKSCITHLTTDLRRAESRLSQLNEYLDGQGIEVEWEDDEGEAGTSQAGTSRGRGSRGRTSKVPTPHIIQNQFRYSLSYNFSVVINFEAALDVFIDSSSVEEDRSSTDYSDDEVIDEIKMEILILEDEIQELEEAKFLRTRVGSVVGHKTINCSRILWNKLLMHDYFRDQNTFGSEKFRRRFRMSRGLFDRILDAVVAYDTF